MKPHTFEVIRNSNHDYLVDLYDIAPSTHSVYGVFEVDITDAFSIIQEFSDEDTMDGMLQGWIVKCFAKAVEDTKKVHAFRKRPHKLLIFDEVDIYIVIEKGKLKSYRVFPYIIRAANYKSVDEIQAEILTATDSNVENSIQKKFRNKSFFSFFYALPISFRRLFFLRYRMNPLYCKKKAGTIGITGKDLFGKIRLNPLTVGMHTIDFALGGTMKKLDEVNGAVGLRDVLRISVLFNQKIVSGTVVNRFISRLTDLMKQKFSLVEAEPFIQKKPMFSRE
ncbi:MAG: hypothetical protein JW776_05985 [Candidatus Lokiarchaeota archaeon]|nr:hypothetical protein [Candidatus Lokiarchaeota archaeon]